MAKKKKVSKTFVLTVYSNGLHVADGRSPAVIRKSGEYGKYIRTTFKGGWAEVHNMIESTFDRTKTGTEIRVTIEEVA